MRNIIRIITEIGLRVYKELMSDEEGAGGSGKRSGLDSGFEDSERSRRGSAHEIALEAFREQIRISGPSPWSVPERREPDGHQKTLKTVWHATLRRAKVPYFRIYDLRSTYATRLSAGGVADEWVTQLLRQGDAKVFKKYSQMKLQMKREALQKLNRQANETGRVLTRRRSTDGVLSRFCHGRRDFGPIWAGRTVSEIGKVV